MTASASAQVVASGRVGPLAIRVGSSPGISEISSVSTRAGAQASASRPPLSAERCLRTQFISPMLAPLRSSALLTACLSSSVRPGAGAASSAEPPPEIKQSTRSSAVSPRTASTMRWAARWPAASGTGWGGLHHFDAPAVGAMAVTRDHQPRQLALPVRLHGLRHRGGGLARANHHGAALRRRRQVRRQAVGGADGRHGGIEQVAQQRARWRESRRSEAALSLGRQQGGGGVGGKHVGSGRQARPGRRARAGEARSTSRAYFTLISRFLRSHGST